MKSLLSLALHVKHVLQGKHPMGASRSGHWPTVRKNHLEKHPTCEVCGGTTKLEVHHLHPFHLNPNLELLESNLITLCEGTVFVNCHLNYGHLGSFKSYNTSVREDSEYWLKKIKTRPTGGGA